MKKSYWQIPAPVASKAYDCFLVSKEESFSIRITSPSQGFRILKFLMTKFYARGQRLDINEEIIINLVTDYFLNLRNKKFSNSLHANDKLAVMQLVKLFVSFRFREYPRWALAQIAILQKSKSLMSPRAFLSYKNQFSIPKLIKRRNRRLDSPPPPKTFIGVGYRDKGTAKVVSHDGSPSWSEVASETSKNRDYSYFREERQSSFEMLKPYRLRRS